MLHKLRRDSLRHAFLLAVAGLVLHSAVNADTYFVATTGDDTNSGSESQPWRTIAHASATVTGGDTVRIHAGQYTEHSPGKLSLWFETTGTATSPITFEAFGDGDVRITNHEIETGPWTQVNASNRYYTTYTLPSGGIGPAVFDNQTLLEVVDSWQDLTAGTSWYDATNTRLYVQLHDGSDPTSSIIRVSDENIVRFGGSSATPVEHIILDGLILEYGWQGLTHANGYARHITVRNGGFRYLYSNGMQNVPYEAVIENCFFSDIAVAKGHGIYSGSGSENMIVRGCTFERIGKYAINFYPAPSSSGHTGHVAYGNVFRDRQNNHGEVALAADSNEKVYNNLFFCNGGTRDGVSILGQAGDRRSSIGNSEVYNNSFYNCQYAFLIQQTARSGNIFKNNLMIDSGVYHHQSAGSQTFANNLWFENGEPTINYKYSCMGDEATCHYDIYDWMVGAGSVSSIVANPLVMNSMPTAPEDFQLKTRSPAIDAGATISGLTSDYAGASRPSGPSYDIGAYEAQEIACWKFDETAGTVAYDLLAGDHDLSAHNISLPTGWVAGRFGGAIALDGTNDHLTTTSDSNAFEYTGGEMTVSAWFIKDSADANKSYVLSKPWNNSGDYNYFIRLNTDETISILLGGATTWTSAKTAAFSLDTWTHIAFAVDESGTVEAYVDGTAEPSQTHDVTDWAPTYGDADKGLTVGAIYPYGTGWAGNTDLALDGKVDDIRVYARLLTASEISALASQ